MTTLQNGKKNLYSRSRKKWLEFGISPPLEKWALLLKLAKIFNLIQAKQI